LEACGGAEVSGFFLGAPGPISGLQLARELVVVGGLDGGLLVGGVSKLDPEVSLFLHALLNKI